MLAHPDGKKQALSVKPIYSGIIGKANVLVKVPMSGLLLSVRNGVTR
jgi:hypothetical protein